MAATLPAAPAASPADMAMISDLEHRTFQWFWDAGDPRTGLVPDRYPSGQTFSSVASIGFGLTAYGIGATRGYITRAQAATRTLATLRYLLDAPRMTARMPPQAITGSITISSTGKRDCATAMT
ncbi:hypothetical protein RAA17_12750 [Komagataeibacter rhaeticus]|nr:hypothetical protein [Komagataeibacter rhaeticus]